MNKIHYFLILILIAASAASAGVKFGGGNSLSSSHPIAVLLPDTTYGSTNQIAFKKADRDSVLKYMQSTGYFYDVIYRDTLGANIPSLRDYKTILLIETSNISVSNLTARWRDSLKSFLGSGSVTDQKSLIVFGGDFAYNYAGPLSTRDSILSQAYMRFAYRGDDGSVAGQDKIVGVNINVAEADSLIGTAPNFYPDYVQPLTEGVVLYQHAGRSAVDSVAGVGVDGVSYNSAAVFVDPRYVAPIADGSGGNAHLFDGVFEFIINAGGVVPVELTSFAAAVTGKSVTLTWTTATETNNSGFEIERRKHSGNWERIGYAAGFGTTAERQTYSFLDENVETGTYLYRLKQIDYDGSYEYSDAVEVNVAAPVEYHLAQNYPNPFNPVTRIAFSLPSEAFVKITVHNTLGQKVAELVNERFSAGEHFTEFNASGLASGAYYYRIEAGDFVSVKKMILMK